MFWHHEFDDRFNLFHSNVDKRENTKNNSKNSKVNETKTYYRGRCPCWEHKLALSVEGTPAFWACQCCRSCRAEWKKMTPPKALKCCLSRLLKLRKIRLIQRIKHWTESQGASLHFPALIQFSSTVSGKSFNVCVYFLLCRFAVVLFHLIVVVVWFLKILTVAG